MGCGQPSPRLRHGRQDRASDCRTPVDATENEAALFFNDMPRKIRLRRPTGFKISAPCVSDSPSVAGCHHDWSRLAGIRTVPSAGGRLPKAGGAGFSKPPPVVQPTLDHVDSKAEIITQYKVHEKDTGSCDVQIALLTARINHLTEHLRAHRKDFHSRRGLLQMASRRRKLLDYLKRHDLAKYNDLLQRLSLRK